MKMSKKKIYFFSSGKKKQLKVKLNVTKISFFMFFSFTAPNETKHRDILTDKVLKTIAAVSALIAITSLVIAMVSL